MAQLIIEYKSFVFYAEVWKHHTFTLKTIYYAPPSRPEGSRRCPDRCICIFVSFFGYYMPGVYTYQKSLAEKLVLAKKDSLTVL